MRGGGGRGKYKKTGCKVQRSRGGGGGGGIRRCVSVFHTRIRLFDRSIDRLILIVVGRCSDLDSGREM